MDENKDKLQTTGEHSNNLFMKRTLHLLVSICVVFCFVLCNSSGFSLFAHSFSFFTHTLERKYVFLICNGILAFLAKSSSSSSSSVSLNSSPSLPEIKAATLDVEEVSEPLKNDAFVAGEEEEEEDPKEEEPERENELLTDRKGEGMDLVAEHDEVDKERCSSTYLERREEQDEEEGEHDEIEEEAAGTEDLETEELNRKIEEFIRKMKEEIRIEAQTQLIAV